MSYNFPFNIKDVYALINVTERFRSGNTVYVDCPVCSVFRKGKMNIDFDKSIFRCNRCDSSGGMLDLYILFGNSNLTRSEARFEIIEKLDLGEVVTSHNSFVNKHVENTSTKSIKSSPVEIDKTYRCMLSLLKLEKIHENKLLKRGLSKMQILENSFKSTLDPKYVHRIAKALQERGCQIEGVPGFYFDEEQNKWLAKLNRYLSGIFVPMVGLDGLIHGLQIRLDRPFSDGTKYIWFSSSNKNLGVSSGAPINFAGDINAKSVYIVDGGLKSKVANCLSGKAFLGNQGANQVEQLRKPLMELRANGTKIVVIAYDNDKYTNLEVNKGYVKLIELVNELDFNTVLMSWALKYKGIDDFLLSMKNSDSMTKVA